MYVSVLTWCIISEIKPKYDIWLFLRFYIFSSSEIRERTRTLEDRGGRSIFDFYIINCSLIVYFIGHLFYTVITLIKVRIFWEGHKILKISPFFLITKKFQIDRKFFLISFFFWLFQKIWTSTKECIYLSNREKPVSCSKWYSVTFTPYLETI